MIIISDLLTIIGSILKMEIQAKVNFFPICAIVSIRFALTVIYFFQSVRICRVNDFFQTSYWVNLELVAAIFLNLVRKSFIRWSFQTVTHRSLRQNHWGAW